MSEIKLKYFSIIKDSGQTLLSINVDREFDENLISGFLTALYSFGTSSLKEQMENFSIQSEHLRLESAIYNGVHGSALMAFGVLSNDVESKYFRMFSERVLKDLYDRFSDNIENWDGEVSKFKAYKGELLERIKAAFVHNEEVFEKKLDDVFEKILSGDMSGLDEF